MLNHIKSLLKDAKLRQELQETDDFTEAVKLIRTAGAAKGYNFPKESVSQVLTDIMPAQPEAVDPGSPTTDDHNSSRNLG
ncbi:MAG: hypothetical protein Kow00121_14460 [Elainellaceae cyanobacterium]